MKLNIAISVDLRVSLFSNGINQNGLYLAMLFQDLGHNVTLISSVLGEGGHKQLEVLGVKGVHVKEVIKSFDDKYDIIIGLGLSIEDRFMDRWRAKNPNVKLVAYKCGNELFTDMETIIHGAHEARAEIFNKLTKPATPDQIWSIPQMENTNLDYYSFVLHQDNATVVPFVWDPAVMENYMKTAGYPVWNGHKKRSIGVMEPNLSIMKNVLTPIMILDRYLNEGHEYSHAYLFSTRKFSTNKRLIKLLSDSRSGLVKKITAEDRLPTARVINNYVDVILSWQIENNLNYLYFDAAWMGYPVVHNAKFCQDVGYYYPDQDTRTAVNQIVNAFENHTTDHLQESREKISRFTRQNPELLKQYDQLLMGVVNNRFTKYKYNWQENRIDKL